MPTAKLDPIVLSSLPQSAIINYIKNQLGGKLDGVTLADPGEGGSTPPYIDTPVGQGVLQKDGTYRVMVVPPYDPKYSGGVFGSYWADVKPDGTIQDVKFQKNDRSGGWVQDHMSTLVPAAMLIMGGYAALSNPAAFASSGGWTSGFDLAGGGALSAPISESAISALGSGATVADVTNAIAQIAGGGSVPAGFWSAIAKVPANVLASIPSAAKTLLSTFAPGLFAPDGSLNTGKLGQLVAGGIGIAGAMNAIDSLKDQGTKAQGAYNDLGTGMFNDYNALGQNILGLYSGAGDYLKGEYGKLGTDTRGQFSALGSIAETKRTNLGTEGKGLFDILGQDTYDKYAGLAGKYGEKYLNVANDIKNNFTDFTPWSLKTTIGSSDGKNYTLNPDQQAVVDNSTQTASGAFGAANSLDLANLRNQEYNLMEQTYAPKDEADRVALENRMRAQGRLGLNYGTYGSTPEVIALEEAIKRRNLQSYLTADDNAMKRYQGLISSGVSAAGVPLQYDTQGLKTLQSGVDFGNTQFGNELRGTQTWADQANKAIGAEQGLETTGLQGMLSNRNQGINFYTGQKAQGIGENIGQSAHGIDLYNQNLGQGLSTQSNFAQRGIQAAGDYADKGLAGKYQNMAKGIAAKLGSEQKALEALIKLYNGITGMNLTSSAAGGNPANVIAGITKALKDQGVPDNVINEYILNNTDPMNTGGIFEPNYSSEDLMSMFQ